MSEAFGHDELLTGWRRAAAEPFQGWDFSRLSGRMVDQPTPWSYRDLVGSAMRAATSVLDLGTAAGEVLLSMQPDWPTRVLATEGWPPNVPLARAALEPHGVQVLAYDADTDRRLPLADAELDLIIDRHEVYDAEVARVLRPGGRFITQQVGHRNLCELATILGPAQIPATVTLDGLSGLLTEAGMVIERAEDWIGQTTFSDVAALVCFLSTVPFTAPADFTVDDYAEPLLRLHAAGPARGKPVRFSQHRFLIIARNQPKAPEK